MWTPPTELRCQRMLSRAKLARVGNEQRLLFGLPARPLVSQMKGELTPKHAMLLFARIRFGRLEQSGSASSGRRVSCPVQRGGKALTRGG